MNKKNNWLIAVSLLIVAFANLAKATNAEDAVVEAAATIPKSLYDIGPYDIVYGKEAAPIQVLEYYSLACPHCSYFYLSIFPQIKKEYIDTGKVRWIKRSLVSDAHSLKGTLLLGCVGEQAEEKYLAILLRKQSSWAYQKDFMPILANIASLGGMSNKNFQACMNNTANERVLKAIATNAATIAKISGTPSFYINQNRLVIFSESGFQDEFNKILNTKVTN